MNSLFFPVFKRGAHVSAAGGGPAVRPADNGGQAPRPHAGQVADQQDHKHPHQQAGRVGQRLQQVCLNYSVVSCVYAKSFCLNII